MTEKNKNANQSWYQGGTDGAGGTNGNKSGTDYKHKQWECKGLVMVGNILM